MVWGREQPFLQSYAQLIFFSEVAMEWQARAVLPLLLVSLPFSQPGAVQFDPSTIDSTIANYEFVFVNFYADWYVLKCSIYAQLCDQCCFFCCSALE